LEIPRREALYDRRGDTTLGNSAKKLVWRWKQSIRLVLVDANLEGLKMRIIYAGQTIRIPDLEN